MTADKTSKKWKHLYAAVWRKSVQGNVLNKLGQLCAWKAKKELFGETLGEQNSSFVLVKHSIFHFWSGPSKGFAQELNSRNIKTAKITTVSDTSLIVPALCDVITDTASYRHCYLAFALGQAKFSVFSIFIKMAPWLLHCSKLCPRSFMPLTARSKGASTMTDPRILEVAPTKGCSKQIHDLLAGGRFLLVPGCFCVGPSQSVSLLILSGLHHDFGTFSWGIGNFIVVFLCSWSCRNRTLAFFGWHALLFTLFWWLYEWVLTWTCIFVCQPMTKSVACSQDGATNWPEAMPITCLCNSMYSLYQLYP